MNLESFLVNVDKWTSVFAALALLFFLLLIIQNIRFSRAMKKERMDAIKRSKSVLNGQMVEQIAPYLPNFPCNPCDAKFLGKPVDFVAFKGLESSDKVDEILFIEVKTGTSRLSEREKSIKTAVEKGKVRYVEYRF